MNSKEKNNQRYARKKRVRFRLKANNANAPRLVVSRSNNYIYAQVIDDLKGITLCGADSRKIKIASKIEAAKEVGKLIANEALGKNIKKVVFDRGAYLYHGRIKALAEGAREGGLEF